MVRLPKKLQKPQKKRSNMEVLKFPHEFLFETTNEVIVFDQALAERLSIMHEAMERENGLGLAANQLGFTDRMFIMKGPDGIIDLINPIITWRSILPAKLKEGCLSAPGDFLVVPSRKSTVQVKFQDSYGQPRSSVFRDLYAVCAQHEIDHLNGNPFFADKSIPKAERRLWMKKWGIK